MTNNENLNSINRILQVAEDLFSEKGFNGTSVNMIAEKAEVNKALIYYYFKDKNAIINCMFEKIIRESDEYVMQAFTSHNEKNKEVNHIDAIREELKFMLKRKKILSIMIMEALKGDDKNNYLFKCAESVFKNELNGYSGNSEYSDENSPERQKNLAYEFFTGFIPIIAFVAFFDKWSEYFQCDSEKAMDYFLEAFSKTHLGLTQTE